MTVEQLELLKSMSPSERVAHFFKKLNSGELSKIQYAEAIKFCQRLERGNTQPIAGNHLEQIQTNYPLSDTPMAGTFTETLCNSFDGTVIEDKPATQKQRLLAFLSDYCWHDTPSIISAVYGVGHQGVCRISERVRELKADGHNIESRKKSQTVQEYKLNNPNTLI